ncbi:hypothetical protein F4779DRAFT_616768 [Xylariaceae sp. FL0662B]|nr:hypothetical protein F4779DRAFT_616768 [Xylariaceae sp. FL0662B]
MHYQETAEPMHHPLPKIAEFIPPETPASIDAISGETRSRSVVLSRTKRLIRDLADLGFHERSVVAFWSPKTIEYAAIYFGIIGLGATVATFLIVHFSLIETARLAAEGLSLSWIMQSDGLGPDGIPTADSFMPSSKEKEMVRIPPEEVERRTAITSFTSGIAGPAKAVTISRKNLTSNPAKWNAVQGNCRETEGTWIAFVGLSGRHGLMAFVLTPMRACMTVVVMAGFNWHLYLSCVERHRPEQLHVDPW